MPWVQSNVNIAPDSPQCLVQLATNVNVPATDTVPVTQWKSTAEIDPLGMYHYNQSGSTWIQIPFAGRWLVHAHSVWDKYTGGFNPDTIPSTLTILVNGSVAQESGNTLFTSVCSSYETILDRMVFSAGAKITFDYFSTVAATVLPAGRFGTAATFTEDRTYVLVRYLGPV